MRGSTLIEAMVSVAIIGIAGSTCFLEVNNYRTEVARVRRGYAALGCSEREVEWLRTQPHADVLAVAKGPYRPRSCPEVPMRLSHRAAQDVFVLEARTVSLPFITEAR